TRYRGRIVVKQAKVKRPHYRWTPAGKVAEPDSGGTEWLLEISGLLLQQPYASVRIDGQASGIVHRMFALAEALGPDGRDGAGFPTTSGSMKDGFWFGDSWLGWANYTEPLLAPMKWPAAGAKGAGGANGLAFAERPNLPTLLDPSFDGAHDIWLARFKHMLDSG